ncbi:MAG TPA: 3'-5' exoribonuclease [Burkholderiaceae bacterium]|nr:3'-5' exoribonuclease [Burkholderiaceae bacterium]
MKRIYFDTEFLEDGRTIELLSIGLVDDTGATYYAINAECDTARANDWVKAHVLPVLQTPPGPSLTRDEIRRDVLRFCGDGTAKTGGSIEFWTYNGQFDWVVLNQLFGPMGTFPAHWPSYCMDLKQWRDQLRAEGKKPKLPKQTTPAHHALNDALWLRDAWHVFLALAAASDHTTP